MQFISYGSLRNKIICIDIVRDTTASIDIFCRVIVQAVY